MRKFLVIFLISAVISTVGVVIYRDNLVGKITESTSRLSKVNLITNSSSSFAAKTVRTNAIGIINGEGGKQMIFGNIYKGLNEVKSLEVLWCQLTLAVEW